MAVTLHISVPIETNISHKTLNLANFISSSLLAVFQTKLTTFEFRLASVK